MKTILTFTIFIAVMNIAVGQGTLVYDQQSTIDGIATHGNPIQALQPMGQSFTPSLSTVGFIQLRLSDGVNNNGQGAFIYVNLLENSITGNVVAATSPIFLPNGFFGTTNFIFLSNIPVNSGISYYFQPIFQSGDVSFLTYSDQFGYVGGTAFFAGQPDPAGKDFWFREGIVVTPEPSCLALLLGGVLAVIRSRARLR